MMTLRPLRNRLAGLALLLQVLAAFGATHGLVLCVGAAGHVAVEDYEAASHCRESGGGLDTNDFTGTSVLGASPACVDTPLLAAGIERSNSPLRFAAVAMALAPIAELPSFDAFADHAGWTRESRSNSTRILKSIVLLI